MTSKRKSSKKSSATAELSRAIQHVAAAAIAADSAPARKMHELKSWPEHFAASTAGMKPFEVRKNDRDFRVGDLVKLQEWIPLGNGDGKYTGREMLRIVAFIARNAIGLQEGYIAMAMS